MYVRSLVLTVVLLCIGGSLAQADQRSLKLEADQALKAKRYDEAITKFEILVKKNPRSADLHNALGYALYLSGRLNRAIFEFRQALKFNRYHKAAQHNLILAVGKQSVIYADKLEFTEALNLLQEIESAYSWHPEIVVLKFFQGKIAFYRGDPTTGLAIWREVAGIRPSSATAKFIKAYDLMQQNRLQKAGILFQKCLKQKPEEGIFRNYYGLLLARLGKIDSAISQFTLALEDPPPYVALRLNLADLYRRTGKLQLALKQLLTARQMRPDYASIHLQLAAIYRSLGQTRHASRELGLAHALYKSPILIILSDDPNLYTLVDGKITGAPPTSVFVSASKPHTLIWYKNQNDPQKQRLIFSTQPDQVTLATIKSSPEVTAQITHLALKKLLPSDQPAPIFTLKDRKNRRWRLFKHLHRRPILLLFWKYDNAQVQDCLQALVGIQARLGEEQFAIAAIHTEPRLAKEAQRLLMILPSSFAQLWDDGSVAHKYKAMPDELPSVILIDQDGFIAFRGQGIIGMTKAEAALKRLLTPPLNSLDHP